MISHLVREVVLPPGCLLVVGVVFLWLLQKKPRAGKIGLALTFGAIYILSIPLVSMALTEMTHEIPARSIEEVKAFKPEAVVVLGSGVYRDAPEYGGESRVSSGTYKRLACQSARLSTDSSHRWVRREPARVGRFRGCEGVEGVGV